ncbi:MAG TPA: hypothetical protein VEH29_00145, partial [Acidimicrobiales bacterium]|nr:hypothetical protein [Acidimicrobiales bacterium]
DRYRHRLRRGFRRTGRRSPEPPGVRGQEAGEATASTAEVAAAPDGRWPATLAPPWLAGGKPASVLAAVAVAVVVGAICFAVLPPGSSAIGAAVTLATLLSARFGGTRSVLTLGVVTAAVLAGGLTVAGQMTYHYPPGDSWPGSFSGTNIAAFVAFVALAADALVEITRQRSADRASPAGVSASPRSRQEPPGGATS